MQDEHSGNAPSSNVPQKIDNLSDYTEEDVEELNIPIYPDKNNKDLYKIILEIGEGTEKPSELDKVTVVIYENEEKLTETLDLSTEDPGFSRLLQSMKKNELSELYFSEKKVKVKLTDWVIITDILEDGSLLKTLLHKGDGYDYVEFKDDVRVKIRIYQGDTEYENSERDYYCEVPQIPTGLFEIVKSMKLKERSTISIKHSYYKANFEGFPEVQEGDVYMEITILKLNKVEDMYLDGAFYRKTVVEGKAGVTPNDNATVKILYKLEILENVVLSNFEEEPVCLRMDEEEMPTLWSHCIKQMKEGDTVKVEVDMQGRHSHYFNDGLVSKYNYDPYRVPDISSGILYISLVAIDNGREHLDLSYEDRVVEANRIKDVGNKLFKLGRYEKALEKYEAANSSLEPITDRPYLLRPVHFLLYGNMTLCHLKLEKYHEAETHARTILDNNPTDVKALYRRALARIGLQNYDPALQDLKNAKVICEEKADKEMLAAVNKEILRINTLTKESRMKEKAIYKNLFSN